jgi:hypothetical protein
MQEFEFRIVPAWMRLRREGADVGRVLALGGVTLPPVDVVEVARRLDVTAHRVMERRPVLRLVVTGADAVIWMRDSERPGDLRLMLAYALGHLLLAPEGAPLSANALEAATAEDDAAAFARALVLPDALFAPYARAFGDDPPLLAEHFGVPVEAVVRRLADVLAPAANAI